MLPSIVGEAIAGFALASIIVALAALLGRARSRQAHAERAIAFERELATDLLAQSDALDRLVAAVAGLADDLDEQRVLDRIASATRQLLSADAALVVELSEDGLLVCAAHDSEDDTLVPPPLTFAIDASSTLRAGLAGHIDSVAMSAPGLGSTDLAVIRGELPFSTLELAQLRVLADFGSRARQNARLFTLARSLRAQAEERERERARLSDRLLTAEEQERRRLSLALHDGPQQTIAGVGLMLEAALSDLGDEEHQETTRVLRLAMDRTRGIVRELRRLTFALEPITLRDHGFSAAFGELAG
ncbi:MAG: Histidine kinase, partial [Gaiellales bacterium]|nr:Histidine kinase [Gaiellales bacterium]